jgi:hypothetical protein
MISQCLRSIFEKLSLSGTQERESTASTYV